MSSPTIAVVLDAVIVAVTQDEPRVLTVRQSPATEELPGLPSGALDVERDRTLDRGVRRWVREQTGIDVGYVEQLYTFGDRFRSPAEREGGPRVLSIAYLALVREERPSAGAAWHPWYEFLPWEDHRTGEPEVIGRVIRPAIDRWIGAADTAEEQGRRAERAAVTFGTADGTWDPVRALERYELLYHLNLLEEARGRATGPDQGGGTVADSSPATTLPSDAMVFDHRRIVATALARLRGKITYRPVVFELLPEMFTLLALQTLVEALAGEVRHKQNFRRLVERSGLVEPTGETARSTGGGRPAKLYRFRRDVVRERPRPGVGIPARG